MAKIRGREVDLFVYDFDGVMTDNTALLLPDGSEAVVVNRSDGLAVAKFKAMGVGQYIISTEENLIVSARAQKLGIPVLQAVENKAECLAGLLADLRVDSERTAFVGNDLNDLQAMQMVGLPIAPNDAYGQIKSIAAIVTQASGGRGVIRELLDIAEEGV